MIFLCDFLLTEGEGTHVVGGGRFSVLQGHVVICCRAVTKSAVTNRVITKRVTVTAGLRVTVSANQEHDCGTAGL